MKGWTRALVYLLAFALVLAGTPLLVPPDRAVSYGGPPWVAGDGFTYETNGSPGGSSPGAPEIVYLNVTGVNVSSPFPEAEVRAGALGGRPFPTALQNGTLDLSDGGWSALGFLCGGGITTVLLGTPLPWGLSFPLGDGSNRTLSTSARGQGSCGNAELEATVTGGYVPEVPPGGNGCLLYYCGSTRTYWVDALLTVTPAAGGPPWFQERWRGVWDPVISGWRSFSLSPGAAPGYARGSVNFTLFSDRSSPTLPVPGPLPGLVESVFLILVVPVAVFLVERRRSRRARQKEEAARREFLASLAPPGTTLSFDEEGPDEVDPGNP